jgi:hypothetical protein
LLASLVFESNRKPALPVNIKNRIANALKEASRHGMGVSRLQVMRRVGDLTKKMKLSVAAFKGKSPGKDWFDGFMKRHPDLSIRKPEKLTTTRDRMLNPVVLKITLMI